MNKEEGIEKATRAINAAFPWEGHSDGVRYLLAALEHFAADKGLNFDDLLSEAHELTQEEEE